MSKEPSHEQTGVGPSEGVLLDVGFDAGALIVFADAAYLGREVWLSRRGELSRIHVEVLERSTRAQQVYAAVFPSLRGGDYEIWVGNANPATEVTIVAGEVLEVRPYASWE